MRGRENAVRESVCEESGERAISEGVRAHPDRFWLKFCNKIPIRNNNNNNDISNNTLIIIIIVIINNYHNFAPGCLCTLLGAWLSVLV